MTALATKPWDSGVMRLNVDPGVIGRNICANIARPIPQIMPHEENHEHLAIVGCGWSLDDTYEELRQLYFDGVKLVALNGSARWLMERNLRPSMHIVLDARPDNIEFVREPVLHCRYLLGSQCDPALVNLCLDRDVHLFHVIGEGSDEERQLLDEHYFKHWQGVPSCGTVGITAILLCRILGFRFQHLFGIDSCYAANGRHHAFPQALNENEGSATFICAGREFQCSAWQASQAENFIEVVKTNGHLIELTIHGDGVLAHMVQTGASLSAKGAG